MINAYELDNLQDEELEHCDTLLDNIEELILSRHSAGKRNCLLQLETDVSNIESIIDEQFILDFLAMHDFRVLNIAKEITDSENNLVTSVYVVLW